MIYSNYRYIYPCRPRNPIPPSDLDSWDIGSLIAQPKLNGSNCVIFTNGIDLIIMNRHNQPLSNFQIDRSEIMALHRYEKGQWIAINAEYMNKAKLDESSLPFNHKLVIFDILVDKSDYLIGKTFLDRVNILKGIYGENPSEKNFLYKVSDNIYMVKTFETGFKNLYDNLTKIDMVEGLVLKRKNARLESGFTENNNTNSQLKCRKQTKNYKF